MLADTTQCRLVVAVNSQKERPTIFPATFDLWKYKHHAVSLEAFAATEFNEFLSGQTASSGCEGFPTFRELTSSPTAVLVLPNHQHTLKMQSWCYQTSVTPYRCSLGATKTPSHPTDAVLVLPNHQHTLKMQSWYYQTSVTP